jgi:hypothetical protein
MMNAAYLVAEGSAVRLSTAGPVANYEEGDKFKET